MILKSIIKENTPTSNGRIYKEGSLQKFKDYLQPVIDSKTLFVLTNEDAKSIVLGDSSIEESLHNGYVLGFVEDIKIIDGEVLFDISVLKTYQGESFQTMVDYGIEFKVDFYLKAKFEEDKTVDLSGMELKHFVGVTTKYKKEEENE